MFLGFSALVLDGFDDAWGTSAGAGGMGSGGAKQGIRSFADVVSMPARAAISAARGGSNSQVLAQLTRMVKSTPQVVVKVTGRQSGGAGHTQANFEYIAGREGRDGRDEGVLTSEGQQLIEPEDLKALADEWEAANRTNERRPGATSISMILSMPEGTDADRLRDAAIAFAQIEMAGHRWVLARHTDTPRPHIHLTVKRIGEDLQRLAPNRDDLSRYRETFAQLLRDRGVEADATPRKARGVGQKNDKTPIHQLKKRAREKRDPNLMPRIQKPGRAEAAAALSSGIVRGPDDLAQRYHRRVRDTYTLAANELGKSADASHQTLARSLLAFVENIRNPETRHEKLMRLRTATIEAGRDKTRDQREAAVKTALGKDAQSLEPAKAPAIPVRKPPEILVNRDRPKDQGPER